MNSKKLSIVSTIIRKLKSRLYILKFYISTKIIIFVFFLISHEPATQNFCEFFYSPRHIRPTLLLPLLLGLNVISRI